ncbi:hypothetical protein ACFT5C_08425 [Streptomyces sp. NPDC057116]|uniref:hypothetical protein n=1 Tax=Streptomyces sp. NPDC057116 TaxID=3346023 RepID=UPI00363315C6
MSGRVLHGLTWSVYGLHRRALLVFGGFLVAVGAALIALRVTGPEAGALAGPCGSPGSGLRPCGDFAVTPLSDFAGNLSLASTVIAWSPLVLAFWAGAVLTGAELQRGTAGLAWTQGVTPARWLLAKLSLPVLVTTSGLLALCLLYRWARGSAPRALSDEWYYPDVFVAMGPVVLAYGLLALAVGALAGLLVRRALPAGGIALALTGLAMVAGERWRSTLWTPADTVWKNSRGELGNSAWQLESGVIAPTGRRIQECAHTVTLPGCREARSAKQWYAVHHPSDHFWPLQLVETGILLALAALATVIAFRVLRRHHA